MGRMVLHERSNSKNNELPVFPMIATVSQKDDEHDPTSISKLPTMSTSRNFSPSGPHAKAMSDDNSGKPRTPTSIANSAISFDSLPPVPPLHINKIPPLAVKKESSSGSVSTTPPPRVEGLEQFYYGPPQTGRPSIYVDTVTRKESSQNLRTQSRGTSASPGALPASSPSPRPLPQQPTQSTHSRQHSLIHKPSLGHQPRPIIALPKPILKRTNYVPPEAAQAAQSAQAAQPAQSAQSAHTVEGVYLPPQTAEEYHERRNSWVERTFEQRYNYSRMHGRSLRIVRSSEEEEARDELTEIKTQPFNKPIIPESPSLSSSPDSSTASLGIRKKRSLQSILSDSVTRPGTATDARSGIPSWARYFYSKDEVSLPEDDEKPAPGFAPRPEGRFGSLRRMASARLSPSRSDTDPILADPEDALSRWSYPHLERSKYPLSPVEYLKNRQLVLFCLGFILPFCWIVAALLPLPGPRPAWRAPIVSGDRDDFRIDVEASLNCTFKQERIFLSHEYWRKINRGMSAVGVILTSAIIALAVVAIKMS